MPLLSDNNDIEKYGLLTYNRNYVHNRLITFVIDFCFTEDHASVANHVAGNSETFLAVPENSVTIRNKSLFWIPLGRKRNIKYLIECYPKVEPCKMTTKELIFLRIQIDFSYGHFDPP